MTLFLGALISFAALLLACAPQQTQQPFKSGRSPSLLSPRLHQRIDKLRIKWGVKGLTIALAASPNSTVRSAEHLSDDWTLETLGFGQADKYDNEVDGDTLFAIASNSKVFNALSLGLLIHNNTILSSGAKLEWTTKVKDILHEWKLQDRYASDHVDLLDLGTAAAGNNLTPVIARGISPVDLIAGMRHLKASTEMRRDFQYNNHHYITMGLIIERVSGLTLPEYVQQHIFDPVGLKSATYNSTHAAVSGHRSDGADQLDSRCLGVQGCLDWWTETDGLFEAGAGGILLSAIDMKKWVQELLNPTVLPPSIVKEVTTAHTVTDGKPTLPHYGINGYGIGQVMYSYRGFKIEGHTGSVPGQMSTMTRVPELGFGFMLAVNQDNFGSFVNNIIQNEILDEILEVKEWDLVDWEKMLGLRLLEQLGDATKVEKPRHPKVPKHLDIAKLNGHYHHKAYGAWDLVKVENPASTEGGKDGSARIVETVYPKINITGPIYLAEVDKIFVSHLVFFHFDDNLFNWTTVLQKNSYNSENEVSGKITNVQQTGTAVFTERGVGMYGDYWGSGAAVGPAVIDQHDVKGSSEVWYERT
uniref:Beta-lactamase-related domain-containing protein n=1 Tax=Kwoniella dejecticola CBS 10117 TaxID=1296121 RepID=A0A1A5ZUW6_9TREE|nr:uncharacterized protein I303_08374 [Kwoniella dejecticola CBS 10117]OBR81603.1 hypothetical protein I303_08374 [Kwoniella dejecticola CBS 10117]